MQRDIEYWQDDLDTITLEPKTVKGRTTMLEEFPIYQAAKQYKSYLANTGALRWEFPKESSVLKAFLQSTSCSTMSLAPHFSKVAKLAS